jgi:glycosyltransferase 2 family protein
MRRLETILIVLGFAFYAWLIHRIGPHSVMHYVQLAGWGLALTVSLEAAARLANTLGWRISIVDCPRQLTFMKLFAARIAGEAIDYTTPSAQLGGQFVMAMMVRRELEIAAGLASVVIAALAEAVGQIGFVVGALLISLDLASSVRELFWPVVAGLVITIGLALGFFYVQTKRPFFHLWKLAAKLDLPAATVAELDRSSARADELLLQFYEHHRLRLLGSCLCYLFAWSLGPLEIYWLLGFLGQARSLEVVLLTEALGILLERATFLIPGKLVSQEGGKALILGLLGYAPGVGFAVGLLRRIKELIWVLFGLTSFGIYRVTESRSPAIRGALDSNLASPAPMARSAE